MSEHSQYVARYQHLRQVVMEINNNLARRLSRERLDEGGNKLGILQEGTLVLDSQDEIAVLLDFCLHDIRPQGRTAIEEFLAEAPYPAGSDEELCLRAL